MFIFDLIHCLIPPFWLNFVAFVCAVKKWRMFLSQPAHYPNIERLFEWKTTWLLCIYGDLWASYSTECHWTIIWKMALILNHAHWQRDEALDQSGCVRYIFLLMCLGTVYYIWIVDHWNEEMEKKIAYGCPRWISKRFKRIIMLRCATRSTSSLKKTLNCESGNMQSLCLCKNTTFEKHTSTITISMAHN